MLTSPNLLISHAYGVLGHTQDHNSATTPFGIYFSYDVGPSKADDLVYCGKTKRLVRMFLSECSLASIFSSSLLMVCLATYWAIPEQRHPLAYHSDIRSVH